MSRFRRAIRKAGRYTEVVTHAYTRACRIKRLAALLHYGVVRKRYLSLADLSTAADKVTITRCTATRSAFTMRLLNFKRRRKRSHVRASAYVRKESVTDKILGYRSCARCAQLRVHTFVEFFLLMLKKSNRCIIDG